MKLPLHLRRPLDNGIRCLLLTLWVVGLAGCATNPVTGKSELHLISEGQEIQIGTKNYLAYQQQEGGALEIMPEVTDYVRSVGRKLVAKSDRPSLPYDFVVLNNSVPNAWALPGGKIAVNRGLLVELGNEAELAAVLGHEIVHAAARHTAKSMEKGILMQTAVIGLGVAVSDHDYADIIMAGAGLTAGMAGQKFSRDHERESDQYGMKYMHKAGYDTQSAVDLQQTFVRISKEQGGSGGFAAGLFASHPPSQERVENNRKGLFTYPPGGFRGETEYRTALASLFRSKPAYDKLGQGYKALAAGRAAEALGLAKEAIALEPREALFHGLAAKSLQKQGRNADALEAANQAVSLNPNFYEFYLVRAQLRQKLGRPGAREDFAASHRLLPTATAASALGMMALNAGDRRSAAGYLQEAASAPTPEGRQAAEALHRLLIVDDPGRLVACGASLNERGFLVLQVGNRGSVPLRNIVLAVQTPMDRSESTVRVPGSVPAGRQVQVTTSLGPFNSVQQARNSSVRVVSVQAAGP